LARNPRWAAALRRDLDDTKRRTSFLRAPGGPSRETGEAGTALLCLYRDDVYETKLGLVLASALRMQGSRIVVSMPSNRGVRVRRYARAFGIDRVVATRSIALSDDDRLECEQAVVGLLAGNPGLDAIKAWRFRDWSAGLHVLSSLIRTTFDGSPDLDLEDNRERLAAIALEVATNYVRAERLLEEIEPRVLLVEEANYSTNGPTVDVAVARDVDVIQTIGIWREDALMSKRITRATRRVDAKSVDPATFEHLRGTPLTTVEHAELDADFDARYGSRWKLGAQFQPDTEPRSAAQIVDELGLDRAKPTAVVFAHVLWDASLFFGVDLFENYTDWLVQTVGAAIRNPSVNWVVKAHPSNVFRSAHGDVEGESSEVVVIHESFPALPDHVKVLRPETKISTVSLYRFADFGVTVRGTPGLEMACFGKSVFTAGTGAYSGLGFTDDSQSVDEYLARLATIESTPAPQPNSIDAARRYAHTLFVRRPWPTRSFELRFDFSEGVWQPLDRNVVLLADSVEDARARGDLGAWAEWALDDTAADYLPTQPSSTASH
jgi:hypothetical protein